jgi:hypothetical protein
MSLFVSLNSALFTMCFRSLQAGLNSYQLSSRVDLLVDYLSALET